MQLGWITPEQIPALWPQVRFHLQRAVDRGWSDWRVIEDDVLNNRSTLWVAYDLEGVHAAAITQVTWDGVCEIIACGGKRMKQFMPLLRQIEFFSRNAGCKAMRIIGRKGWARMLPDYKCEAIVLERPL